MDKKAILDSLDMKTFYAGGVKKGMTADIEQKGKKKLYATVKLAVENGLSVWPPKQDGSKRPYGNQWKDRQTTPATVDELRSIYRDKRITGVGIICGAVSGNLECLDQDDQDTYDAFKQRAIETGLGPLVERIEKCYMENTPAPGVHWLYRCTEISGNTKLATRPKRPEEMKDVHDKTKTLIETRGEGGYIIIAPTYGSVNPAGPYDLVSGSLETIPTITPEERRDLFNLARSFHIDLEDKIVSDKVHIHKESSKAGGRPGDDFNERATWKEILEPHGWQLVYSRGGVTYWRRPGKERGISASTGHAGTDFFHNWSSSTPFEANRSYGKFSVFTILNHSGDSQAAAKELASRGYGDQQSATITVQQTDKPEWPEPIPLNDYSLLPDFPVDVLPGPGCEMVKAVSEVNQVDTGMTASIYLSILSTCTAKKSNINLISHKEPLNIYTCSILPSGNRKSSTMDTMTKPLYEYQAEHQYAMQDAIREALNAHRIREARLAKLQKQAANTDDPAVRKQHEMDAAEVAREISENPVPKVPLLIVDDVTTEALGIHMAENNERMAVMSTEGGIFELMAGRYNDKSGNLDLYLKAHSGDSWSSHRVGREAKTMQSPALTMCLTVQPDVITDIGQYKQFRGRGLLARFLYSLCKSQVGYRERQVEAVPETINRAYQKHIEGLMDIPMTTNTLKLSPDAQALWDEFYNDVEADLREGGSLHYLTDWGSKLPGAIARIAGLLHFAEYGLKAIDLPISVNIVSASCVIGGYFKEHALATFGLMEADPAIEAAKKILNYLVRQSPEIFKGRDVLRHTNFKAMDEVTPGLKILVECGYIREAEIIRSIMGRPEAVAYEVYPQIKMLKKH